MQLGALERTLYRSVLRFAKELEPASRRGSLTACPDTYYSRSEGKVVPLERASRTADDWSRRADDLVDALVFRANGESEFYAPPRGQSLREAAAAAARDAGNFDAESFDAAELGMAAVRQLSKAAAVSRSLAADDAKRPPARREPAPFALRGATDADGLVGSVLVSHPMACLSQPTLHGAIILLVAAEDGLAASTDADDDDEYVMGVVVNKRAGLGLRDAATPHGATLLGDDILDSELYVGGDVAGQTLTALRAPGGGAADAPTPPWFTHDLGSLRAAIEDRDRPLRDYKVLCGYCGWTRSQLLNEIERSVWFRAAVDDPHAVGLAKTTKDGIDLWRDALAQLSADHAELARLAHDHDAVISSLGDAGVGPCTTSAGSS